MRCPNCGARIRRNDDRCLKCGTKVKQIQGASNKLVTKAKKEYQPELVVYTTLFPADLSYKKTLLLCIFLGWFGGHLYYVKRPFKAVLMTIMTLFFLIAGLPCGVFMQTGDVGFLNEFVAFFLKDNMVVIPCVVGAISFMMWVVDLIKIITRTFPVPVVLAEEK